MRGSGNLYRSEFSSLGNSPDDQPPSPPIRVKVPVSMGRFIGYNPIGSTDCPDSFAADIEEPKAKRSCSGEKLAPLTDSIPLVKEGGFSFDELRTMWKCSHAEGNNSEINQQILPEDISIDKTKWKSILTVEPKAFFKKFLSQYPGDTRATQPVLIFSHKPLNSFEEVTDICKVIDVAVVPDRPDVCVAITETYHDVASYHMLHAERQTDGSFTLAANSLEGRVLPSEKAYSAARALLLEFFLHGEYVQNAVAEAPRYGKGKDAEDMELFLNSISSAGRAGINKNKFCVFTTSKQVYTDMKNTGIKLASVGTKGDADVGPKLRRNFIQAWLAFCVANSLNKMMWQSPATVWFERPDNIVHAYPVVETLWAYKGRKDKRASPFFISFDFFVPVGVERPIHLLHEIVLHFDLVITWDSIDAVTSYRVLHADLMENDPAKIKDADFSNSQKSKQILSDSGLWYL
eukprot:gene31954-41450_t